MAIVPEVADDEEWIRQERRVRCGKCPFQIICVASAWPAQAFSCKLCSRVSLSLIPGGQVVRCTETSLPAGYMRYRSATTPDLCRTCGIDLRAPTYEGIVLIALTT